MHQLRQRRVVGLVAVLGVAEDDVRADVLPVGERHHTVDEVVVPLVEVVVTHGRDLEAGLVERVDRRHVLLDEGLEGRGADQVAGRREHGVGVLGPQRLHRTGQRRGAGLGTALGRQQAAVEVVDAQELDGDVLVLGRRLGGRYRDGQHGERQPENARSTARTRGLHSIFPPVVRDRCVFAQPSRAGALASLRFG